LEKNFWPSPKKNEYETIYLYTFTEKDTVMIITLGSFLITAKVNRCGVIPYVITSTGVKYLLAKHNPSREYSDFGGGVKKSESSISGGVREFHEETNNIFRDVYSSVSDFLECISIVDGTNMAIVFVPVKTEWLNTAKTKFCGQSAADDKEVSEVSWIDEQTFDSMVFSEQYNRPGTMWRKIQVFFRKANVNIHSLLKRRELYNSYAG
jgi:hypothetical protein